MNKYDDKNTDNSIDKFAVFMILFFLLIINFQDDFFAFTKVDPIARIIDTPEPFLWFSCCAFVFYFFYAVSEFIPSFCSWLCRLFQRVRLIHQLRKPILIYRGDPVQNSD